MNHIPEVLKKHRDRAEPLAYRVDDAVDASGLSRATLYSLIAAGKLPSIKAAGRRLILADDLRAFLESQREVA